MRNEASASPKKVKDSPAKYSHRILRALSQGSVAAHRSNFLSIMPTMTRAEQAAELTKAKAAEENWNSRKAAASLGENAGKNAGKGAASSAGKAGAAAKAKTKKRMSDEPAAADEEPAGAEDAAAAAETAIGSTGAKRAKTGQDELLAAMNGEADDGSGSESATTPWRGARCCRFRGCNRSLNVLMMVRATRPLTGQDGSAAHCSMFPGE